MPPEGDLAGALILASGVAFAATPLIAALARKAGILDFPAAGYKQHERATPYLGGVAVLVAMLSATLAFAGVSEPIPAIVLGAVAICAVGTLDDWRPVSRTLRVTAQTGVGVAIWGAGAGWETTLPDGGDAVATAAWIVVAANSFNLLDNLDGTTSGAAATTALGTVAIAIVLDGTAWSSILAAAVAGSCLGFLWHNLRRPSRVFLGDGGSTMLGYLIAVAVIGALRGQESSADLLLALLMVGVPLLDTAVVVVTRARRGRPILAGGRDHLTHRLRAKVSSDRQVVALIAGLQIALSLLALLAANLGEAATVTAVALYLIALGATCLASDPQPPGRKLSA